MRTILVKLKHQFPLVVLTLSITLIFLLQTAGAYNWGFISKLENFLYDTRVLLTMPGGVDPRIVIVDIDERSLAEIGRFPWGRDKLAKLLEELFDYYHAALVGYDIIFREPDQSSGIRILDQLSRGELADIPQYVDRIDELRGRLDYDQLFIDSLKKGPVILSYTTFSSQETGANLKDGALPSPVFTKGDIGGKQIFAPKAVGYGANLPEIQANAVTSGHITPTLDDDGVVRRVPMLIEFEGDYYESLSLAIARYILAAEKVTPVFVGSGQTDYPDLEYLSLDNHLIPVDINVQALVPYRGIRNSFPYVSAVDVMKGRTKKDILEGAIVLVGTSAKGLVDLRSTPVNEAFPGVEIHANLIAGILDNSIKSHPAYAQGFEFLLILLTGLLLSFLLPLLSPLWATVATILTLLLTVTFNYAFWQYAALVLPLASGIVMIILIFLLNMSYGYFIEQRGKRQIATLFGQYIPPELVDEMSDSPGVYSLEAENRVMTVLFSDIRGFTSLSENLSPAEISEFMNEYLTTMTQLIHQHRGTIDKYMGDAIMAFWGAPLLDADHARHALECSLAMLERLNALREEFKQRGWPEIRIGIGLNTGEMSVGNMGSEFRMAYTVLGDTVNLGSRLEGLTRDYGVEIIVSEYTLSAVPEYIYRELDVVRVKGKDEPIRIYEPVARSEEISEEEVQELKLHDQALKNYRNQDWDASQTGFLNLGKIYPERRLYSLYLERIEAFIISPPGDDWDGVYTYTTK